MFKIKRGTRRHWGHLRIYREQRPKTRDRFTCQLTWPWVRSGWSNWNLRGGLKNKYLRHWRLANPLYPPGTVWKSYKRVPPIVGATSTKSAPPQYAILAICYDMLTLVTENLWSDLIGNCHPLYCYASGPYEKQKIKTAHILSGRHIYLWNATPYHEAKSPTQANWSYLRTYIQETEPYHATASSKNHPPFCDFQKIKQK